MKGAYCLKKLSSVCRLYPRLYSKRNLSVESMYTTDPIDPAESTFDKILVANRGEIAVRVMRTARRMGVKTVAVHSDVDSKAMHVRLADESVCIGSAAARESYLCMDRVLEAVKSTGAQAVHPGYGFLSENAEFVDLLEKEGVAFIGPSSAAITGMGDKIQSKKLAMEAGVNTIPGFDGVITDADHCVRVAREIGYPVMIKASAGGGGKGMRVACDDQQARDGFRSSQEEAAASFGDDRILVEKFINKPRHIEIQILADKHGNTIYLNERECSIQRRNQKVIEEAPSVFVDAAMRSAMGEQAAALAQRIGYSSAGTVEFLVDASDASFYFLEMNTRLQVEHPITEFITGVDLVHQMLRIAKGHKLRIRQQDVPLKGWAIESRVYAEDPYKNFGLPSIGRLNKYSEPTHLAGVRCDSGVEEGSQITIHYDPMICKLVTYGDCRQQALVRSIDALDSYVIAGVHHNIPLLRHILTEQRFCSGDITTNYLQEVYPDGFRGYQLSENNGDFQRLAALTAVVHVKQHQQMLNPVSPSSSSSSSVRHSWQLVITGDQLNDGIMCDVHHSPSDRFYRVHCSSPSSSSSEENSSHCVTVADNFSISDHVIQASLDNTVENVQLLSRNITGLITLTYRGTPFQVQVRSQTSHELSQHMPAKKQEEVSGRVVAPMPGVVKHVSVAMGECVSAGQQVCVVEAMKMQNSLVAPAAGTVTAVQVTCQATVDEGQVLVVIE